MNDDGLKTVYTSIKMVNWPGDFNKPNTHFLKILDKSVPAIVGFMGIVRLSEIIDDIYQIKSVRNNTTRKEVENTVDQLLLDTHNSQINKWQDFKSRVTQKLSSVNEVEYNVISNIAGISVNRMVKFGDYRIFRKRNMRKIAYGISDRQRRKEWLKDCADVLIEVSVRSANQDRAMQLAEEKFLFFERIIQFLIGKKQDMYEVIIISPTSSNKLTTWRHSKNGHAIKWSSRNHRTQILDASGKRFNRKSVRILFDGLADSIYPWNKIKAAIDWYAHGLNSQNDTSSIISYCNAIESLLVKEDGVQIAPSIVYSFCDTIALTLGNDFNHRIELLRISKEIYKLRSKGVHTGGFAGEIGLERMASAITRELIWWFVDKSNSLKTEKNFSDWIMKKKYN